MITVAGGHPLKTRRLLEFLVGAVVAGLLAYGAVALAGYGLGLENLQIGLPLVAASGVFLAAWHGWRSRRPRGSTGRQISKRLARARRIGPAAYGAVLGAGVLTIVATPAVWLGLACCLAVADPRWGAVYGASFGAGRSLMLMIDARRSRGLPPAGIGFLVVARQLDPRSRFQWWGVAGGLVLLAAGTAATAFG